MTDIRRLVERVAAAMGPEARPEQVEAVAQAVLDEVLGDRIPPSPPYDSPEPGERAILTAYGLDRPGILAAITNVVSEAGCNILDVSQKILQGYFTLIMLTDITDLKGTLRALQDRLTEVGHRMQVRVILQHEDLFNAMHRP
ncbi:ACT domain-containing protein [Rhodocaloribacter litoris]|uniref:ACT domain-containing protein n=1 Tax=Rhodocaloribacter litoris TaxID=2558931 RepID=UPI00142285E5|nr:ACT domain-containing protein [Rhodocaloribacter litoris]QXD16023.1 ACT domain-containing protein [Rhodocaloribacter litoris]GIV59750.1 MAG: hypothetical protein KatS3mg043_0839 [Rhodothermaceae bacterium]